MQNIYPVYSDMLDILMKKALDKAREGKEANEVPVGAVFANLFSSDEGYSYIIHSSSHNLTNMTQNASKHCEMICLSQLQAMDIPVSSLTLFVTVEPCIMCAYALNIAGIKQVYYGASNSKFGGNSTVLHINTCQPNPYPTYKGLFADQAVQLLQSFYEGGNTNLPQEIQHRKKVKQ